MEVIESTSVQQKEGTTEQDLSEPLVLQHRTMSDSGTGLEVVPMGNNVSVHLASQAH